MAALQGIVLVVASARVLAQPVAAALVVAALAALLWSFGKSVTWLWRARRRECRAAGPRSGAAAGSPSRCRRRRWTRRCRTGHRARSAAGSTHSRPSRRRIGGHAGRSRALTAVAFLLVYLALALPREVDQLTPAALVRIPVEGCSSASRSCSCCPPRVRRAAAVVGGAALGLLTILKVLDMGFLSVLGRPFDPVFDWVLLGNAREFLEGSFGSRGRDRCGGRRRRAGRRRGRR